MIPKGEDWGFELARVRPIALLEAFRKCVTRVITKRLSKVCIEKTILQGPNFASLPEDSTEEPIHILNALLEEAQEKNKELWLLFQDMKKAFGSVSLLMLEKALQRIKILQILIKFIINLYKNRRMRVIMSHGLTKEFTAEDGIDQGEVISPLVWQIFYDPLLERVQRDKNLDFIAKVSNLNANRIVESSSSIRQAVLVYADDTNG